MTPGILFDGYLIEGHRLAARRTRNHRNFNQLMKPCLFDGHLMDEPGAIAGGRPLNEQDGRPGKVGYEIDFNRVFFQYQPPRPLHEIDAELAGVEQRILELLREVTE